MFFNLYGSAVFLFLANVGIAVHLAGGLGATGSSSIDGWLIIAVLAPFFGFLIDRSEYRGLLHSYRVLTVGFFKSINVHHPAMPPWRRVVCFGIPVVMYPWVAVVFGAYHWITRIEFSGPNTPARFTMVCFGAAIVSISFAWFTRDYRLTSPRDFEAAESIAAENEITPTVKSQMIQPAAAATGRSSVALIGVNVVLGLIFLVLIMIV